MAMRLNPTYLTPLLAAGAAAAAITTAPTSAAVPTPFHKDCISTVTGKTCQSPGNVEITGTAPVVSFYPYGNMPYLLGDH
jgi:hypothetical protein